MISRALTSLTALTLAASGLYARQQPQDTATLAPVVVTATKIPMDASAIPAAVTVLSGTTLSHESIHNVGDALRTVPAANVVTTSSYGSQTSLFLRGGEAGYVKVLVDGVPQLAPGGPGNSYDFANLTTDGVDRIEIVRGPASVLYGSDAVTGVVQVFTRDGRGPAQGVISGLGGTYASGGLDATLSGGAERASYLLAVSRFSSDGVYPVNNDYRNDVASARLRFSPDARDQAALALRYIDAQYHFPTDGSGAVVSNNQHQLVRGPMVGLDLRHSFSERVDGQMSAGWDRKNYLYAIAPNDAADSTTFPFSSSDWTSRANVDARSDVHVGRRDAGDVLTVGAAFERETMEGSTLDTMRGRNNGAAYAQLVTGGQRLVNLTLGGRVDDNEQFGTWGTYRVGAALHLAPRTRVIGSVGTGFKEPTFYQNFATGFVQGNPDLKPEHSQSWEIGLEQRVGSRAATARVTYFNQRFRDLIDYDGGSTGANYLNVPEATSNGVEVGLDAPLGRAARLGGSYTWLDASVTKGGASASPAAQFVAGEPLLRRPKHSASATLACDLPHRIHTALTALYVGDREDIDFATFGRVTLPAYARWDLTASAQVIQARGTSPGLAARLRVENLFDRSYEEIANFPARRRTILAGAELRFGY